MCSLILAFSRGLYNKRSESILLMVTYTYSYDIFSCSSSIFFLQESILVEDTVRVYHLIKDQFSVVMIDILKWTNNMLGIELQQTRHCIGKVTLRTTSSFRTPGRRKNTRCSERVVRSVIHPIAYY